MVNLPDPTVPKAPAGGGSSGFGWGSALGGLLSLGGAYLGYKGQKSANATNIRLAQDQMAFSAQQAQRQMDFQREMAGSQFQRQKEDLEKAGLNPLFALGSGGAASPGGASGASASAQVSSEAGALLSTAGAVAQVLQGFQSISQSRAQEELILAQAAKTKEETVANALHTAYMQNQTGKLATSQDLDQAHADVLKQSYSRDKETFQADVARRKAQSTLTTQEIARSEAEQQFWKTDFGSATPFIRSLMTIFGGTSSAVRAFK